MKRWTVSLVFAWSFVFTGLAGDPVLKVAIMSDVQGHPFAEDAGMRNLERALDIFAKLKPDVVVNAGDIGDNGVSMDGVAWYKRRCDARLGALPHVACLGNHELGFIPKELALVRTADRCQSEFNAVFGYGERPDRTIRRTIAGYDFIAQSFANIAGLSVTELADLRAALDASVRRDATKPIFVVTHYHPEATVNDSGTAVRADGLRKLLDAYPQVISFSGHTHNPLQDPRSIWQGGFTAIDTATLCYGCIDRKPPAVNQVSCLVPYGHEAVGCLFAEVYVDRIVIRRYAVRDGTEIGAEAPWTVDWPYDPARPKYGFDARRAAECAPEFPPDAEPTVWFDYGFVYLLFAAARGDLYGYDVELTDGRGKTGAYFHLSDYYRLAANQTGRIVFRAPPKALEPGQTYACRVFPVGFFGKRGRPVAFVFSVPASYPCRVETTAYLNE